MSPVSLWLNRAAHPSSFLKLSNVILPLSGSISLISLLIGITWGLFFSPADWQQGETIRIMYIHVPMAWLASALYFFLAICGAVSLIWRHPLADLAALETGPIGATATALCLITGSLWGQPTWGTWWVWDARLTSMLLLFFLYLGHILTIKAFDDPSRGQKAAAILALAGALDLPIIKFSVQWWNTLHQPDSIRLIGTPTISFSMLWPLLLCILGFSSGTLFLLTLRIRSAIIERRIQNFSLRAQR